MKHFCKVILVLSALVVASSASARDCSPWAQFMTTEEYLEPHSMKPSKVDKSLNSSSFSNGLKVSSKLKKKELWVDILDFPGDAPVVTGVAAIMKIGRLVNSDFDRMVLADAGVPLFTVDETVVREIGCQFIWGQEGGQNPIYLIRVLIKNLKHYDSNQYVTTDFTGSLLGDTSLAMRISNEVLTREWALSAIK